MIHGAYGYPEENWFGWLKRKLMALNIECHVPHLPTPKDQHLEKWLQVFAQQCQPFIHTQTILVGHSLGAAFILRWLERYPSMLKSVILVGAFIGTVGEEKFDAINNSFFKNSFDWQQIRQCALDFTCYHANNDPYVPREDFDFISRQLNAKKIVISKAGHFNRTSGYFQFPHLLNQLKQYVA